MKAILIMLAVTTVHLFAETKISDFQWKNRLLVVSGASEELVKRFAERKAEFEERDLLVFLLSGKASEKQPVEPKLAAEFRKRLSPESGKPMVYLIGKDGRTTLRWSMEYFSFEKLFSSIDGMPMRQREMREQRKGD